MPQRRGFHPYMRLWVVQYRQWLPAVMTNVLKVRFFSDQASHDSFVADPGSGKSIAADYGMQKWYNEKSWMLAQLSDLEINDNFIPNLPP